MDLIKVNKAINYLSWPYPWNKELHTIPVFITVPLVFFVFVAD
jgi:hypothetical protein